MIFLERGHLFALHQHISRFPVLDDVDNAIIETFLAVPAMLSSSSLFFFVFLVSMSNFLTPVNGGKPSQILSKKISVVSANG